MPFHCEPCQANFKGAILTNPFLQESSDFTEPVSASFGIRESRMTMMAPSLGTKRMLLFAGVSIGSFAALGTVSALWNNPLFVRMTPAGDLEIALLFLLSLGLGAYVTVRRPYGPDSTAGTGGVLGFLGIACPVCNKVLLLLFGGELLLTYFEPVRVYVAAAGVLLIGWALAREWRHGDALCGQSGEHPA